jgi:hypothetical protein
LVTIETVIHTLRGERVILDADLAKIYGVQTKVLNQAVKRKREIGFHAAPKKGEER